MTEQTFFMIKPDAVERGLVGEILRRAENKGLQIVALDMRTITREFAEAHYAEHQGKDFYEPLIEFVTRGPLVCGVFESVNAVAAWRQICGETDPVHSAQPGSIRGDYCLITRENAVHGSDCAETARAEISNWFPDFPLK
ncbi:MAG: nucleoside-diphosphate kinase [Lawsonella sp.]|nr:nucleoside-diphosphate kinase [Mycobacteriales bacterium]